MQFYTLIPLLFHLIFLRSCFQNILPLISFILIGLSLTLQINSRSAISFGFVLCRMWQFQAGMLAYFSVQTAQFRLKTIYRNKVTEETLALLAELENDNEEIKKDSDKLKKKNINSKKNLQVNEFKQNVKF